MGTTVFQAVERFASVLQDQPDAVLDRPWAWQAYDSEGVRFACFRTYEQTRELAARLMAERISQGTPPTSAQLILAQYHVAFRDLQALLLGVGDQHLDQPPAENEWPLRTVLKHIINTDLSFLVGVTFALERKRSDEAPIPIPDPAWDEIIQVPDETFDAIMAGSLDGILSFYTTQHLRIIAAFADMSEHELETPSHNWEGYELPLRFRLHRFESHVRQHTLQVLKTLEGIGRPTNEIRHLIRLLYSGVAEAEGVVIGADEIGIQYQTQTAAEILARTDEIAKAIA